MPLYALTIWQPWAWLIAAGYKTIENRPWIPADKFIGQRIAIHASQKQPDPAHLERAQAALGRAIRPSALHYSAILATAVLDSVVVATHNEWFHGKKVDGRANYGWVLRDVKRFAPVPCSGSQRLWRVPPYALQHIPVDCR